MAGYRRNNVVRICACIFASRRKNSRALAIGFGYNCCSRIPDALFYTKRLTKIFEVFLSEIWYFQPLQKLKCGMNLQSNKPHWIKFSF